jgi:hypothetical protein
MMASLDQVLTAYRDTLAAAIPTASSGALTHYAEVPSIPNLPAIMVYPTSGAYADPMGPGQDDVYDVAVAVLVGIGPDGAGQRDLRELVDGTGARSIRRALFLASKQRVDGQVAALGVPHLRIKVGRFDSWGIRFAQVSVDHLGAIVRTTAITWSVQQP